MSPEERERQRPNGSLFNLSSRSSLPASGEGSKKTRTPMVELVVGNALLFKELCRTDVFQPFDVPVLCLSNGRSWGDCCFCWNCHLVLRQCKDDGPYDPHRHSARICLKYDIPQSKPDMLLADGHPPQEAVPYPPSRSRIRCQT